MEATNPQAKAQLNACHTSEMQGERIVKVEYGYPAHEQMNLLGGRSRNSYASLTYTMASGKVFVLTSSMGEINCYRSSVDAEPAAEPPAPKRDPKKEAAWVVRLGARNGVPVFLKHPTRYTTTSDLDEAHSWHYKKDAERELEVQQAAGTATFGLDAPTTSERLGRAGRRSSFRK